jgi:hypothetical protein
VLSFARKGSARNRAAQNSGIRHPCLVADRFQCSETYADVATTRLHAQSQHLGIGFPCPSANRFQCFSRTFLKQRDAWLHVESQHLIIWVSLPFNRSIRLVPNLDSEELRTRVRTMDAGWCPLSLSFDRKASVFSNIPTKAYARNHVNVHLGTSFPCPAAERYSRYEGLTYD